MLTILITIGAAIDLVGRARKTTRRAVSAAVVAHRNGPTVIDALAGGELVTVSTYLAQLGADADLTRRYGPTLGKHAKAAHKAATGRDPLQVWVVGPHGHPITVAAYSPADPALTGATANYNRTAHLVNA